MVKHPSYKKMIIKTLNFLNFDECTAHKYSRDLIRKNMIDFFKLNNGDKIIKRFTRKALDKLVLEKKLIQIKQSFRFSSKALRKTIRRCIRRIQKHKKEKKTVNRPLKSSIKKPKKTASKSLFGDSKSTKRAKTSTNVISATQIPTKSAPTKSSSKFGNSNNTVINNPFSLNLSYNTIHQNNLAEANKTKAVWQYLDKDKYTNEKRADGWYDYEPEANITVEEEWQRYIKNRAASDVRSVKSGEFSYMVDFIGWKQTNIIHPNHKVRQIRRKDENGNITDNPYEMH